MLLASLLLACGSLAAQDTIFEDDFDRADGPVSGWTVASGSAALVGERLQIGPDAVEHWTWAGSPPRAIPANAEDVVFETVLEFLQPGNDATVGRHGGVQFHCSAATQRTGAGAFSGYFVDWIDRPADRGVRLTRVDNGALVELVLGAPASPPEPPLVWRVETDATNIRVYGDDVLLIDQPEATYRGGFHGVWAWSGAELIAYDEYLVTGTLQPITACFTATPESPVTGTDVFFDAGCSSATGTIDRYLWDFGDGTLAASRTAEHIYAFADNYTVTLTVVDADGAQDSVSRVIGVSGSLLPFEDSFDRGPGPIDGWTIFAGDWNIDDAGQLVTQTAGTEHWIWAGDPAGRIEGDFVAEVDIDFRARPADGVGRHGGISFFMRDPTIRWQTSGYTIWWIDRAADFGIVIFRWDNGAFTPITLGTFGAIPNPPRRWRLEVDGPTLRVYGDNVRYVEVDDETYREGHFGFWAYSNGQDIAFDNLLIDREPPPPLTACFREPGTAVVGRPVSLDGGCSRARDGVVIDSYEWDFGDGTTATGAVVEKFWDVADIYTVTLTVRAGPESATTERLVSVADVLTPFADCFDSDVGPVEGWTPFSGEWNVTDEGTLSTLTAGAEHWLWAGSPPLYGSGDLVAEFELEYLFDPMDGVGRHGGIMFYAGAPTARWQTTGYTVWWIDRPEDFGIVVARWENGGFTFLNPGTFEAVAEPPLVWRLEVEGPMIRVFGDEELLVEVEDETYREGHFGLWMYFNGQDVRFDKVLVGMESLPSCDGGAPRFVRGDSDASGVINLADGIQVLNFLFQGGPAPACLDAADADNGGSLQLTDGVRVFNYLFTGGPPPADPSPTAPNYAPADCGVDTGGTLGCAREPAKCS